MESSYNFFLNSRRYYFLLLWPSTNMLTKDSTEGTYTYNGKTKCPVKSLSLLIVQCWLFYIFIVDSALKAISDKKSCQ